MGRQPINLELCLGLGEEKKTKTKAQKQPSGQWPVGRVPPARVSARSLLRPSEAYFLLILHRRHLDTCPQRRAVRVLGSDHQAIKPLRSQWEMEKTHKHEGGIKSREHLAAPPANTVNLSMFPAGK